MHWLVAAPVILISLAAAVMWEAWCVTERIALATSIFYQLTWFVFCVIGIFALATSGGFAIAWAILK